MKLSRRILETIKNYSVEEIMKKTVYNMQFFDSADRVELVDVNLLDKIKEYDRRVQRVKTDKQIDDLKNAIIDNGITDSAIIEFCPYDGTIKLCEGNHRLMIAKELGLPAIPVKCARSENTVHNYKMKLNPENITPREDGEFGKYYYNPMKPSMLGEPFGPNYKSSLFIYLY